MQITKNKVATVDYTLKDDEGNVLDTSSNGEFAYLHGASNIIPGLENALEGKQANDEVSVSIAPADAYGEVDPNGIQEIPRDMFPQDMEIQPGMQFHAQTPDGNTLTLTVVEVKENSVVADANHALAGKTLHFDVKVVGVRDATEEELAHGHVHGPGGHHHHG